MDTRPVATHAIPLLARPLTVAAVWTALPPSRRESSQDYVAQGRFEPRCRRDRAFIGVVHGYQDTYQVYCEEQTDIWQVGCTCGRRQPCAHVGALLLSVANNPESFPIWQHLVPESRREATAADALSLWRWAQGAPFPWEALGIANLWAAPPEPASHRQALLAQLAASRPKHLDPLLQHVMRTAHPNWWEHPEFVAGVTAALSRLARDLPGPAQLADWLHTLAQEPRVPIEPLLAGPWMLHPAIAAAWHQELWALARDHALDARPSHALAARALLAVSPLLDAYPDMTQHFAWADPSGTALTDRLLRDGRAAEAWYRLGPSDAGWEPDPFAPTEPTEAANHRTVARKLALHLITQGSAPDRFL